MKKYRKYRNRKNEKSIEKKFPRSDSLVLIIFFDPIPDLNVIESSRNFRWVVKSRRTVS